MVLFGFKTIDEGEQVLVRNHLGKARLVTGPARVTLWRSSVEYLEHYFANENQYLEVNYRNGPREYRVGPVQLYKNKIDVASIHVKDIVLVSANEALVVYRTSEHHNNLDDSLMKLDSDKSAGIDRVVLYGPMRYVPKPGEWLHEFSWHGEKKDNDKVVNKATKVPNALKFTKLRTIADQMYYNVSEVRTKDDTMISVKLMIFFQLMDIEKMLDNTHDPIADFINACCSDTIQYCSGLTYEEFVENTGQMNNLDTFKQLTGRAEHIGYKVTKVVFRGFHSSEALQQMHDKAIHERTSLRLEADTENHRQKLLDLRLIKDEERSAKERELEREKEEHQRQLEQARHSEQLRKLAEEEEHNQTLLDNKLAKAAERAFKEQEMEKLQQEHKRFLEREQIKLALEREQQHADLRLMEKQRILSMEKERLANLREADADITKVLVAEARVPDKTIKIDNNGDTAVHLHEES